MFHVEYYEEVSITAYTCDADMIILSCAGFFLHNPAHILTLPSTIVSGNSRPQHTSVLSEVPKAVLNKPVCGVICIDDVCNVTPLRFPDEKARCGVEPQALTLT